jgi:hypothetical protein
MYRGTVIAFAAQGEHGGCHPAHLRLVDHSLFPATLGGWFGTPAEGMGWMQDIAVNVPCRRDSRCMWLSMRLRSSSSAFSTRR